MIWPVLGTDPIDKVEKACACNYPKPLLMRCNP